jgi:DNA repair exonuclease SbcCD ATPase subunit
MLAIQRVKINNFIKIKELEVSLSGRGLVLLKGNNLDEPKGASASGKTLFGDAILWAVSDRTTRDIRADDVIGDFDKYASVEIDIQTDTELFTLIRYRGHKTYGNSSRLLCGGNDISHKTSSGSNDRIESTVLGCSFNLFRIACFQNGDQEYHFSRMGYAGRAKVIDEIIGTEEGEVLKRQKIINKLIDDTDRKIRDGRFQLSEIEKVVDMTEKDISDLHSAIDNYENDRKSRIKNMSDMINQHLSDIERKEAVILDLPSENNLSSMCSDLQKKINDLEIKIRTEELKIKSLKSEDIKVGVCNLCKSSVSEKHRDEYLRGIEKQIKECENKLNPLRLELEFQKPIFQKITKERDERRDKELKNKYNIEAVEELKSEVTRLKSDIEKEEKKENVLSIKLDEKIGLLEQKLNEKTSAIIGVRSLEIRRRYYESISAFYGPSGFRPMVMKYISPELSSYSNEYLKSICGEGQEIDISSKSDSGKDKIDIKVWAGKQAKLFPAAWSRGEGQSIDIAMNLGIMKLASIKSGKDFKFMWFDEITNGMSPTLIDSFIRLLKKELLKQDMTIIMTTHNPVNENNFDEVWTMTKKNGESKLSGVK